MDAIISVYKVIVRLIRTKKNMEPKSGNNFWLKERNFITYPLKRDVTIFKTIIGLA